VWTFRNPVRTIFGAGSFGELPALLAGRSYALVTYPDPFFRPLVEQVARAAGEALLVIDDVAPNPDFGHLSRQVARFRDLEVEPDVIVALGGGSVIDSAKVFAAARGDFGAVVRFLKFKENGDALGSTPLIAVPTTAGTGSEVTSWATVWDTEGGVKYSLALPGLYPEVAVVDPELMVGKPRQLTISTGLDALSHALESTWNKNTNGISLIFAVKAVQEILEVLPQLADDLQNIELRSRMARAALFAGLAFSCTKTAIAHAISYPITLRYNVPHGIACSFTLPMVLRSLAGGSEAHKEDLRKMFQAPALEAADMLERFLEGLGVSTDPRSYGLSDDALRGFVLSAFDGERGQNFVGAQEPLLEEISRRVVA
jgi:alcohol dehydrogenase